MLSTRGYNGSTCPCTVQWPPYAIPTHFRDICMHHNTKKAAVEQLYKCKLISEYFPPEPTKFSEFLIPDKIETEKFCTATKQVTFPHFVILAFIVLLHISIILFLHAAGVLVPEEKAGRMRWVTAWYWRPNWRCMVYLWHQRCIEEEDTKQVSI